MAVTQADKFSSFENEILVKLEKLILERNKSIRSFSFKIGIPYQTMSSILLKRQHMNLGQLGKILSGLGGDFMSVFADEPYVPASMIPELTDPHATSFQVVPQIDSAACGTGGRLTDGSILAYQYFESKWLNQFVDPKITTATGDSMEPLLMDGDFVLLDCNPKRRLHPNRSDMYYINTADTIEEAAFTIKRVILTETHLLLVPSNIKYEIQEIELVGRSMLDIIWGVVVWMGRNVKFVKA